MRRADDMPTDGDIALRKAVEEGALAAIGPDGVDRTKLAKEFAGRGASRATLYRWIDAVVESGKVGGWLAKRMREKITVLPVVAEDATRETPAAPTVPVETAVRDALLVPLKVDDLAETRAIPIMDLVRDSQSAGKQVMDYSRTKEGTVRNAKLLLLASEHLRRTVETMARIQEAVTDLQRLEALNAVIIEEVAKESPVCAEGMVERIRGIVEVHLA